MTASKRAPQNGAENFRTLLQQELIRRCQSNPAYSLRSFSKSLGVENSWLSKILRGKKTLSKGSIQKLGLELGLSPSAINSYQNGGGDIQPSDQIQILNEDVFEVISDWYHFAILEMMKIRGFQKDEKWISKKLGITRFEAREAIERLKRVGILDVKPNGEWIDKSRGRTTHDLGIHFTSIAKRRLQQKILEQSQIALQTLPIQERDHSSTMMATNDSKLDEAKRRIDKFRKELSNFLEDCPVKNSVYQLSVGLFPLTVNKDK